MAAEGEGHGAHGAGVAHALDTRCIHADAGRGGADVAPAIAVTTTFDVRAGGPYTYSRTAQPLRDRCEAVLGSIEGGHAVTYASGTAAALAVLMHVSPARVAIRGGYHGTHQLLEFVGRRRRLTVIDINDALGAGDLVWLETPTNPHCRIHDVAAYARKAHEAGAVLAVDATLAPPPLQRCLAEGADFVVHSSSKYLGGHSDCLGGVVVVRTAEARDQLAIARRTVGSVPGSLETWLLLRSLRTLSLRVARQSATADALALWLHAHGGPHVTRVWHPRVPTHPDHAAAARLLPRGTGGVFSFELSSERMALDVSQHLTLFRDATSLGGVESLIEWRRRHDPSVSPCLLRVSCGLEDPADLIADMRQAIARAKATPGAHL